MPDNTTFTDEELLQPLDAVPAAPTAFTDEELLQPLEAAAPEQTPNSPQTSGPITAPSGEIYVKDEYGLLGTVPVEQASAFTPATQSDLDAETYRGRPIETFARTTGNSALLGLPEVLASDEYVEESDKLKEHNAPAAMAGEVTGAFLPAALTGGTSILGGTAKALASTGRAVSRIGLSAGETAARTAVGEVARAGLKSVPALRATIEGAAAGGSTIVRNVADAVAHDDEVTLESATDGALLSTVLGAAVGGAAGKLEAGGKAGGRSIIFVEKEIDGVIERVPSVIDMSRVGTAAGASAARSGGRAAAEVIGDAASSGDNLFTAAARQLDETDVLSKVKNWSTTKETVERTSAELAPRARTALNDLSREYDDVVRSLDAAPITVAPDEVARSIDAISDVRAKFAKAAKEPSYADSDVLSGLEKRIHRALTEELGLPSSTSLDDAVRKGLMVAEPQQSARALGRTLYELDAAARAVDDPTVRTMLAASKDAFGRELSDGVKLLGTLHEGNALARRLDAVIPGLRSEGASFEAAKQFLSSNNAKLDDLVSDYVASRATTLQLAGKNLPDTLDNLLQDTALMRKEIAALKKTEPSMLDTLAAAAGDKLLGVAAKGVGGLVGGAPGYLVGEVAGRLAQSGVDRFVKPMVNRMLKSAEAREGVRKAIRKGASVGLRGLRAAGQGVLTSDRTEGRAQSRRGSGRLTPVQAEKRMEALTDAMDPGTLRGASALVQRELLRAGGEQALADAMDGVAMRQSQALAAKTRELLGEGPDPKNPLSHLQAQENDTYAIQRHSDYTLGVTEPSAVIKRLNDGVASFDELQGVRDVYPSLHAEIVESVGQGLSELDTLPDPSYLSYLEYVLDASLVPSSLVFSQGMYAKEAEQKLQEESNGRSGAAVDFGGRSGYGTTNKT